MKSHQVARSIVSVFIVLLFFLSTCSFTVAQAPARTQYQTDYDRLFAIHNSNMTRVQSACQARNSQECLNLISDMSQIVADAQTKNNDNALIEADRVAFHKALHGKLVALQLELFRLLTPGELKKLQQSGLSCPGCKIHAANNTPKLKLTAAQSPIQDCRNSCYAQYVVNAVVCAVVGSGCFICGLICLASNELALNECLT
jgi:hypothetical protein